MATETELRIPFDGATRVSIECNGEIKEGIVCGAELSVEIAKVEPGHS